MNRNDTPKSHIQFVVPLQYLHGGSYVLNEDSHFLFDGDVDSFEAIGGDSGVYGWDFSTACLPEFTLIYGHSGSADIQMQILHDTMGEPTIEGYAKTGDHWSVGGYIVTKTATDFSSVLLEHGDLVGCTRAEMFILFSSFGDTLRELMFSRNHRVPMHNRSWNCKRSFVQRHSTSYLKQDSPRFSETNEYAEQAVHSFEWTGLSATDKRSFDIFFAAFAGNISRPFAMCVIHGGALTTMDCRMLVIDAASVEIGWSHDREMDRDGVKFTAIELIPI